MYNGSCWGKGVIQGETNPKIVQQGHRCWCRGVWYFYDVPQYHFVDVENGTNDFSVEYLEEPDLECAHLPREDQSEETP